MARPVYDKGINKKGTLQGPWLVEAHRSGRYKIVLRRWPKESGLALGDGTPPFETKCSGKAEPEGVAFPIAQGVLAVNGFPHRQGIEDDACGIHFEIELTAGRHELCGAFADKDNKPLCSAFYAEVTYLN